jgi:hypothetical protein
MIATEAITKTRAYIVTLNLLNDNTLNVQVYLLHSKGYKV